MGQKIAQTGLLGRKAQVAGAAMHVANTDTSGKTGGLLGTAAASGLMGHKGRMAAHAAGLGTSKGILQYSTILQCNQSGENLLDKHVHVHTSPLCTGGGGVTGQRVLGSGLLGNKGVAAAMAMDFVKGKKH